jgi:hypothetical protein
MNPPDSTRSLLRAIAAGLLTAAAISGTAYGIAGPAGDPAKPKDKVLAASFDAREAILQASDAKDEAAQLATYTPPKVKKAKAPKPRVVRRATRVVSVKAKAAKAKAKPAAQQRASDDDRDDDNKAEERDQHEDEDKVEDRGEDD